MKIYITLVLTTFFYQAFSCNLTNTGIGTFDGSNYTAWSYLNSAGGAVLGVYAQDNTIKKSGTHALKVNVTTAHPWGMRFINSCDLILKKDSIYEIRFWANGGSAKSVKVALQQNDNGPVVVIKEQAVVLNGSGWNEYLVVIQSTGNHTKGKIKFTFPEVGTYYIDDVTVDEKSPEVFTFIKPNNPKIHFSGAVDVQLSETKTVFYRFPESYAKSNTALNSPYVSWTSADRACGSSGITVDFKTNSKNIKVSFTENSTNTLQDFYTLAFAVYKNGVFQEVQTTTNNNVSIVLNNLSGASNTWRITLPSFAQVDFTGLEIDANASLEDLTTDNRKVYVAIGNSITQGNGVTNFSTHLTYPWQVADSLGFQLYNWGIGGSKVNELVFDNFASAGITPDVVTVLWGYNDFNCAHANCNTDDYIINHTLLYYQNLMTDLSTAFPNAIIMGILPTYSPTPDKSAIRSLTYLRNEQERILQNLMLTNSKICYFNGADYTNAASLTDDVHLNNLGATQLANQIISELRKKGAVDTVSKKITVLRSEYEKVGDILFDLQDEAEGFVNYTITQGNEGSYFKINSNSGLIEVNNEFPDVVNQVDSVVLSIKAGAHHYNVKIVDAFDHFIATHPNYTRLNVHQDLNIAGNTPYAVYHNVWGKGTAVADQDFRMSSLVHPNSPDSTVFIWDTPGKASSFGGGSIWSYLNVLWGNRYNQRSDLTDFPVRVGDLASLNFEFDVEQLFGTESYKIASNQFFTEESNLAPFAANDGDLFMVFDQIGTYIPPYADHLRDTTILSKPYVLLHDSTGLIQENTPQGYQLRRAIIKENEQLLKGTIDFKSLYNSFLSRGYLNEDLHFPNIQFGIEITEGWGAVRFNRSKFTPTMQTIPPTVSITSPANNASFTAGANIVINANANDADGSVAKVEFFRGTTKIGEDLTSPYSITWPSATAGTYALTARATDNLGVSTTSTVINIIVNNPTNNAPTVSITSPANNASFTAGANIAINANAVDADGSISKVEFFRGTTKIGEDLTSPYAVTWSNANAGTYALTARATDNLGAVTTSSVINITVNPPTNNPPTVNITSPTNNASFTAGANITITANAADTDGSVSKVEFFRGTTKIGEDLTSPYAVTWSNASAGTYALTARATDNLGAVTTSTVINITVNNSTNPCSGVSQYVENGGYTAGSNVQNSGSRYQCRPWPNSGWCNGAAWAYAPGTGAYWQNAWTLVGACIPLRRDPANEEASDYALVSSAPNPFGNTTTITVNVETAGETSVIVFDHIGREVAVLVNEYLVADTYSFNLDGINLQNGMYICKFTNNEKVTSITISKQ